MDGSLQRLTAPIERYNNGFVLSWLFGRDLSIVRMSPCQSAVLCHIVIKNRKAIWIARIQGRKLFVSARWGIHDTRGKFLFFLWWRWLRTYHLCKTISTISFFIRIKKSFYVIGNLVTQSQSYRPPVSCTFFWREYERGFDEFLTPTTARWWQRWWQRLFLLNQWLKVYSICQQLRLRRF